MGGNEKSKSLKLSSLSTGWLLGFAIMDYDHPNVLVSKLVKQLSYCSKVFHLPKKNSCTKWKARYRLVQKGINLHPATFATSWKAPSRQMRPQAKSMTRTLHSDLHSASTVFCHLMSFIQCDCIIGQALLAELHTQSGRHCRTAWLPASGFVSAEFGEMPCNVVLGTPNDPYEITIPLCIRTCCSQTVCLTLNLCILWHSSHEIELKLGINQLTVLSCATSSLFCSPHILWVLYGFTEHVPAHVCTTISP